MCCVGVESYVNYIVDSRILFVDSALDSIVESLESNLDSKSLSVIARKLKADEAIYKNNAIESNKIDCHDFALQIS